MEKKKNSIFFNKIFDFATILSLCGVLLYMYGWIYWSAYFGFFNIDPFYIEIPFSKIIATSWLFAVVSIFYGAFPIIFHFIGRHKKPPITYLILSITCIILLNIALVGLISYKIALSLILLFSIVSEILRYFTRFGSLTIKLKTFIILTSSIGIISLLFISNNLGVVRAKEFVKYSKTYSSLTLMDNSKINGRLVSNMGNKYFFLVPDNGKFSIIVIESVNVKTVQILNQISQ